MADPKLIAAEALLTILRIGLEAHRRGDTAYLKRAAADAAAWEIEKRAVDAARKRVRR